MAKFRLPAEWEKQEAIWLAWPHQRADWPGKFAPIPWVYVEIIRIITQKQRVRLLVRHDREGEAARAMLQKGGANVSRVEFYRIPTNRVWLRDSGPIVVKNSSGKRLMLDFRFTGWAKYSNHRLDDKVPQLINTALQLHRLRPAHKGRRVVLEGGGIDVNGRGTLLTTEEWLLSKKQVRNPGFTRRDYEEIFDKWLGAGHVIWLGKGIVGDDTHGHIDDLARFVNPTTVMTMVEPSRKDKNYPLLADNLRRLKKARDQNGRPLTVVELPMPRPVLFAGERLPPSYANFLITNAAVLVPTFNDPSDHVVLSTLSALFPDREVVGVHAVDLILGLGTLHCMSMQEPASFR